MLRSSRRPELKDFVNPDHPVLVISSSNPVFCKENDNLSATMKLFLSGYRKLPVVDSRKNCIGMLCLTDVLDFLSSRKSRKYGKNVLEIKVSELMREKVYTIQSRENIKNVLKIFKKYGRGAYPVLGGKKLQGIVTESDFIQQIHKPLNIDIERIMTRKPLYISDKYPISDAARIMYKAGFRRLPVVRSSNLVGIISPFDIISYLDEKGNFNLKNEKTPVQKIMKRDVTSLKPEKDIYEAVKIMNFRGIGGILVIEEEKLVGIVTERDVLDILC